MAKNTIDTSGPDKVINDLKKALTTRYKGAKAGYLTHDKGKIPYEDTNPPDLEHVALWNEFGTERIPARPFIRNAQNKVNAVAPKIVQARMEENADIEKICSDIGLTMQRILKESITRGTYIPNAPITIEGGWMRSKNGKPFFVKGKKSTRPLVDTHNLVQSIHWGIKTETGDVMKG